MKEVAPDFSHYTLLPLAASGRGKPSTGVLCYDIVGFGTYTDNQRGETQVLSRRTSKLSRMEVLGGRDWQSHTRNGGMTPVSLEDDDTAASDKQSARMFIINKLAESGHKEGGLILL